MVESVLRSGRCCLEIGRPIIFIFRVGISKRINISAAFGAVRMVCSTVVVCPAGNIAIAVTLQLLLIM
jgi:hypothetical protein